MAKGGEIFVLRMGTPVRIIDMVLNPSSADQEDIRKRVLELEILTRGTDTSAMLRKLQDLVPTFNPAEAHGLTKKAVEDGLQKQRFE